MTRLEGIPVSEHLYACQNNLLPSLACNAVILPCPETDSILETYGESSLGNLILSEELFSFHTYGTKQTGILVRARYPYYWPFLLINPDPPYQRITENEGFIQRYYGKTFLLVSNIHKYLTGLFLKSFFSALLHDYCKSLFVSALVIIQRATSHNLI